MQLDETDLALLRELGRDAGRTNIELAAAIGLSPPATLRRVRRLRESGVIQAIRADIKPSAVGWALRAVVLAALPRHEVSVDERFSRTVADLPEVVSADWVTGEPDAVLNVVARDVEDLHRVLVELGRAGASRVLTHLIVKPLKAAAPLPDPAAPSLRT